MSFSIRYCDIELEHYLQKHELNRLLHGVGLIIGVVKLCVLRYDLRALLLALCLVLLIMLCIAPFISLRPKKRLVRRASHIASRPVLRVFYLSCFCGVIMPRFCATTSHAI